MTYDVIIIGGGAAGLMAAYGAATALSSRKATGRFLWRFWKRCHDREERL